EQTELLAPHEHDVVDVEKVLVPTYGNAVLRHTAKTESGTLGEGTDDFSHIADRLRDTTLGAAQLHDEGLDLEPLDADDPEAFVEQVLRKGVAGRSHTDDQDVLAIVS